mmetsp:Transcript_8009/g.19801  ORF Transcript_8009/g.19801 Transcript_8009/m.19801 type:complete len:245 (-) Transcript_8009:4105-4839(-)
MSPILLAVHADEFFEIAINVRIIPDRLCVLVAPGDPDVVASGAGVVVEVTTCQSTIYHLEDVYKLRPRRVRELDAVKRAAFVCGRANSRALGRRSAAVVFFQAERHNLTVEDGGRVRAVVLQLHVFDGSRSARDLELCAVDGTDALLCVRPRVDGCDRDGGIGGEAGSGIFLPSTRYCLKVLGRVSHMYRCRSTSTAVTSDVPFSSFVPNILIAAAVDALVVGHILAQPVLPVRPVRVLMIGGS